MVTRRKTLTGIGAVVVGGGVAIGTGAFTAAEAERQTDVSTAGDVDARFAMAPNDGSIDVSGGVGTSSTGDDLTEYPGTASEYIGENEDIIEIGEGEFNLGASTRLEDVLLFQNNGTQDIGVHITDAESAIPTPEGGDDPVLDFEMWDDDDEETISIVGEPANAAEIPEGEVYGVTIVVNTQGETEAGSVDFPDNITIHANSTE